MRIVDAAVLLPAAVKVVKTVVVQGAIHQTIQELWTLVYQEFIVVHWSLEFQVCSDV